MYLYLACPKGWIDYKNKKCLLHSDSDEKKFFDAHKKCITTEARLISHLDTDLLKFGEDQDWKDYWTSGIRVKEGFNPHRFYWDYGWYGWHLGDISNWNIDADGEPDDPQNCLRVDTDKMKDKDCDNDGENELP